VKPSVSPGKAPLRRAWKKAFANVADARGSAAMIVFTLPLKVGGV
jgi:hypothetical protein